MPASLCVVTRALTNSLNTLISVIPIITNSTTMGLLTKVSSDIIALDGVPKRTFPEHTPKALAETDRFRLIRHITGGKMNTETALSGTLKDFGLVEILQVVELGTMTGALHLKQGSGRTGILYFNEGKLASCSEMDPGALTLGDVLQQLGMT